MNIAISLLGPSKDSDSASAWKPSIALARQKDLPLDQYYLLYQPRPKHIKLKNSVIAEIRKYSPQIKVIPEEIDLRDVWDFEEVYSKLYDFCRKHNFFNDNNNYYIHITNGSHVAQICLFLLAESHRLPGKLIQTYPGNSPDDAVGCHKIIDLNLAQYDQIAQRFSEEEKNDQDILKSGIATRNKNFNKLIEDIERVAKRSREPILLTGPTGAGKTELARKICTLKQRLGRLPDKANFIAVNCATLRGDNAMSTLFGHKKGAYTGAVSDRAGLLKKADKGILFLDEIGELGLDEQAMLLRAVETKRFCPLGADEETRSDFELICGTNRDLKKEVQNGKFRADLLERINLWPFRLPGLADRREDIEPNLQFELKRFEEKNNRRLTFNKEAKEKFLHYALDPATKWQGNFRELNAAIVRMATMADGGRINEQNVADEISRLQENQIANRSPDRNVSLLLGEDCRERFDEFDLCQLEKVIEICRQCKTRAEAGKKLFAVSRKQRGSTNDSDRLGKYLQKFGLTFDQCRNIQQEQQF